MKIRGLFLLLLVFLSSCDVEKFEDIIVLNTPLGLTATMQGGNIVLEFSAFNDEDYFTGYQVFGSSDSSEESLTNLFTNICATIGDASTNVYPMSQAQRFSITVVSNYDDSAFSSGNTYFFMVRAYSYTYSSNSLPSNIAEIVYEP